MPPAAAAKGGKALKVENGAPLVVSLQRATVVSAVLFPTPSMSAFKGGNPNDPKLWIGILAASLNKAFIDRSDDDVE